VIFLKNNHVVNLAYSTFELQLKLVLNLVTVREIYCL